MDELGTPGYFTDTYFRLPDTIHSNNIPCCYYCEIPITDENDSGWEAITSDGMTTQPMCKTCNKERGVGGEKAED